MNAFPQGRIAAISYGSARPLSNATGSSDQDLAANRRVDVVVLSNQPDRVRALIPQALNAPAVRAGLTPSFGERCEKCPIRAVLRHFGTSREPARRGGGRTRTGASHAATTTAVIEPAAMIAASTTIWNRPASRGETPPKIAPTNAPGSVTSPVVFVWSTDGMRAP